MRQPLALVVLLEAVVIALLGWQVFGSRTQSRRETPATPATATTTDATATPTTASLPPNDLAPTTRQPADTAPATAERRDPANPIGILLHGTVRDQAGASIAKARVTLRAFDESLSCHTATNGTFALAGLRPGSWTASVHSKGYTPSELEMQLDHRAVQRQVFTLLPEFTVKVHLRTPDGENAITTWQQQRNDTAARLQVIATETSLPSSLGSSEHDPIYLEDSVWIPANSTLRLHRSPPVWVHVLLRHFVLASQPLAAHQRELTFTIDLEEAEAKSGNIQLRVVDSATGTPIQDANVVIGWYRIRSDGDGKVVARRTAGIHNLHISAPRHESVSTQIKVHPAGTLDLSDFQLSRAIEAKGRVIGLPGIRLGRARVTCANLSRQRFPQPLGQHHTTDCDADGNFQLEHLGRSRYLLIARDASGNVAHRSLDTTGGGDVPFLEMQLQAGTPIELVAAGPFGSYTVVVIDDRENLCEAVGVGPGARDHSTLRLLPGTYTLRVFDSHDRLVRSVPLTVGDSPFRVQVP
jgi:hypothetical protein